MRFEKRKFLLNISKFTSTDHNIKRRKKRKKTLLDHTDFISGNIKYMDLVPQPKQFCFYKILFISRLIINIIGIRP